MSHRTSPPRSTAAGSRATTTRPPYAVGERVAGLYAGPRGTTLANGTITSCTRTDDGGWRLVVDLGADVGPRGYRLSATGHSDYICEPYEQGSAR